MRTRPDGGSSTLGSATDTVVVDCGIVVAGMIVLGVDAVEGELVPSEMDPSDEDDAQAVTKEQTTAAVTSRRALSPNDWLSAGVVPRSASEDRDSPLADFFPVTATIAARLTTLVLGPPVEFDDVACRRRFWSPRVFQVICEP